MQQLISHFLSFLLPNIEYLEILRVVARHFAAYPEARKIVAAALGRL